jgi:hypothetical protein
MDLSRITLEQFLKANASLSVKRIRAQAAELGIELPQIADKDTLLRFYYKLLPKDVDGNACVPTPAPEPVAPVSDPSAPKFVVAYYGENERGYWAAGYCFTRGKHTFDDDYFSEPQKAEIRRNAPHLRVL